MKKILLAAFVFPFFATGQASLNTTLLGNLPYNRTLNDIWGYADSLGNEYALVGLTHGFSIVDVTNPVTPTEVLRIPGSQSVWRDIKTWKNFAYVTHDIPPGNSNNGLLIVDLDSLATGRHKYIKPEVYADGDTFTYVTAHNLWVDEKGFLYLFGTNANERTLIFDLNPDPYNPIFIGTVDFLYHHDGYVRNDTLWASAIWNGELRAWDVSFKPNPTFLGSVSTPGQLTHNAWLSDDGKSIFTTDEISGGFITAFDVRNPVAMRESDRYRVNPGSGVFPHNVHVFNDYLVTSYYTAGLDIADASDPKKIVRVGYYDTSPLNTPTTNGAWGAYPFLPSGNVLVSDMEEGLFIIGVNYQRAGRVEITVINQNNQQVVLNAVGYSQSSNTLAAADLNGQIRFGQLAQGPDSITVSAPNFDPKKIAVQFVSGNVYRDTVYLSTKIGLAEEAQWLLGIQNPVSDQVNFNFSRPVSGEFEISVYALSGKKVAEGTWNAQNETRHKFPLQATSGLYLLQMTKDGLPVIREKIIVE